MLRIFSDDKRWLLLAALLLVMTPVSRAQAPSPSQAENQDQVQPQEPIQSQDEVQAQDRIQSQDEVQGEAPIQGQPPLQPAAEAPDSQARIVRISYVDGQVRLDRGQGYESATMNVPVTERDWLQTRSDGWAEVQFEDGSLVRLAPDTVVAFTQLSRLSSGAAVTTVDLDQGEAEFRIAGHSGEFQVTVKNKTITPDKAGWFRVTSTNSDPLEIAVWKGQVAVNDPESGGEVAVKKNETFTLDPTDVSRYALDQGAEADQLDQWSQQRDQSLNAYASAGRGAFQSPYQYGTGDLNYYGEYFDAPGYGTVWQPTGVGLGWDPFNNGYWSYSPGFGNTWVSAYPWGWLPFRYGNWVYLNNRGWCWVPGSWNRWHVGPRWVNAPPGFHPPIPPAQGKVAVGGRRVVVPGSSWDRGGAGRTVRGVGTRADDRNGENPGLRQNRRVFTNDDVETRMPRTVPKIPAAEHPAPGAIDADRRPATVEHQPGQAVRQSEPGGVRGDRGPLRSPAGNRTEPEEHALTPNPSRAPRVAPTSPARQYNPPSQPVRQYTAPQQPARQYTPPPAAHSSAPARSYSPPAAAHSALRPK